MIIYVLDDGETYTVTQPTPVVVTTDQLDRIEGGEKVYQVVPDWHAQPYQEYIARARADDPMTMDAEDFFVQAGIAAAEAIKEAKRNYTKSIVDAQNQGGE